VSDYLRDDGISDAAKHFNVSQQLVLTTWCSNWLWPQDVNIS